MCFFPFLNFFFLTEKILFLYLINKWPTCLLSAKVDLPLPLQEYILVVGCWTQMWMWKIYLERWECHKSKVSPEKCLFPKKGGQKMLFEGPPVLLDLKYTLLSLSCLNPWWRTGGSWNVLALSSDLFVRNKHFIGLAFDLLHSHPSTFCPGIDS